MNDRINRYANKHYDNKKDDKGAKKESNENKYVFCHVDDFITNRLNIHERETLDLECNAIRVNCIVKQGCTEETQCWIELSSLVKSKKSIGFPLVRGVKTISGGKILYFEQFKNTTVEKLSPQYPLPESILFQVLVIMYSMYKNEIYVDNFEFDIVNIPKTTFHISVNQIFFDVCTDKLVLLSLSTRPYKVKLPQSCYLSFLQCFETASRKSYYMSNYFFEWLIKNHMDLLARDGTDLFKIRKRSVVTHNINRFTEPGTVVIVARDDMYVSGITLTNVSISDNVRVIFSTDGGNILEIDDFNIYDVFISSEYILRTPTSSIII
ncbi:protein L3 [BeAn 58058 virus]|uniref:protein L3 n=1 Tax=BeAn 58058 virus TaxID=67082 RepID=UPI00090B05E3|nr:protein L3 [BeAn 58058 virus]APG58279.1 protein L3 [BeAn 58058 virus]